MWRRRFTLRTDHQALTTLLSINGMTRAGMRIASWSARLMCFQYNMQYHPGSQNVMADCLSCVPLSDTSTVTDPEQDLVTEIAEISPLPNALLLADFRAECKDCSELAQLRQVIHAGWPRVKKSLPDEVQPYFLVRHELAAETPLIFRGTRLVVPKSLRESVVRLAHEGYQDVVCTKQGLRELYWWPLMDDLVHKVLSSCTTCQTCDKTASTSPAPMQPVQVPECSYRHCGSI